MKKIIISLVALILVSLPVFALFSFVSSGETKASCETKGGIWVVPKIDPDEGESSDNPLKQPYCQAPRGKYFDENGNLLRYRDKDLCENSGGEWLEGKEGRGCECPTSAIWRENFGCDYLSGLTGEETGGFTPLIKGGAFILIAILGGLLISKKK